MGDCRNQQNRAAVCVVSVVFLVVVVQKIVAVKIRDQTNEAQAVLTSTKMTG